MKPLFYHFLLCLFVSISNAYASVTATIDRQQIALDESFQLEIVQQNAEGNPDFSPLLVDFEIISRSQSQQIQVINGNSDNKTIWSLTLMAKKAGKVVLPAITVGNEQTQAIPLNVLTQTPVTKNDGTSPEQVMLNMTLEPQGDVYVQQQLTLRVQILLLADLSFAEMNLSSLNIDNARVEKVGEDRQFSKLLDQRNYHVIERVYIVYPQKSGELSIPSLTFKGAEGRRDFFGFSQRRGKTIVKRTEPQTLQVLPKPANFSGQHWLPVENLSIETQIPKQTEVNVGDAVTLTVTMTGQNIMGEQLPNLTLPDIQGIKTYPDKPEIKTFVQNGKIMGSRTQKWAVRVIQAGNVQIPAQKLFWWHTSTNQQKVSEWGALQLTAKAVAQAVNPNPTASVPMTTPTPVINTPTSVTTTLLEPKFYQNHWFWVSMVLLFGYGLIGVDAYVYKRRAHRDENANITPATPRALYQACKQNDAKAAMQQLSLWLPQQSESIRTDEGLQQTIKTLEACLYAKTPMTWAGVNLHKTLKRLLKAEQQQQKIHQKQVKYRRLPV